MRYSDDPRCQTENLDPLLLKIIIPSLPCLQVGWSAIVDRNVTILYYAELSLFALG